MSCSNTIDSSQLKALVLSILSLKFDLVTKSVNNAIKIGIRTPATLKRKAAAC